MPTRIILVDDHPALLRGLASVFDDDRFTVVGTGDTSDGLVELVREKQPDVVVADLSMPGDVFDAIAQAAQMGSRIVIFTAYADPKLAVQAIQAGALGFVLKGRPADDLLAAVCAVQAGEIFVSPELAPRILAALHPAEVSEQQTRGQRLSNREQQIVDGLLRAKTNKEIARELNLSEKTIKHYMTNLMAKLGAKNRLDVVLAVQATPTLLSEGVELVPDLYRGA